VVRAIETEQHGTYLAVVNTGFAAKKNVTIRLRTEGIVTDAATGQSVASQSGRITLSMHPCQLQAIHIQ
jgi:hypothetical protein